MIWNLPRILIDNGVNAMGGIFVHNWRRVPRVPVKLTVEILCRGKSWGAESEDLGPGGCLLVSPHPLVQGAPLRLILHSELELDPLDVSGNVAWVANARGGIAFAPNQTSDPQAWFKKFLAAQPQLAAMRGRAPSELALEAPLYFLCPPRQLVPLSLDEQALLRYAENGILVRDLLAKAGVNGLAAQRALLALFEKNVLTLSMGQASDPWRWRALLPRPDQGPLPVVERTARMVVVAPTPCVTRSNGSTVAPRAAVARSSAVLSHDEATAATPLDIAPPPAPLSPAARSASARTFQPSEAADRETALLLRGVNPSRRSAKAQAKLEAALRAASTGHVHDAVALLRQALVLAPRDPEISKFLGELAFSGGPTP